MKTVRIIAAVVILLIGLFVALSPNVVYAPTPRVVLYVLISMLFALLFAGELTAHVKIKLPTFMFSAVGAGAFCIGLLWMLTYLSKPEQQIAVFHVVDEAMAPAILDWKGAVEIPVTDRGLTITRFIEGNTIVLIFPEQVGQGEVRVKKSNGQVCAGKVSYSGNRSSTLAFGRELPCQ